MNIIIKHIIGALILSACLNIAFAAGPPSRIKPVVTDTATLRNLAPTAEYSGTVISKNDARISSEVEGRLTWVADVGAMVQKGDVVARLDDIFLQQQRSEELAIIQSEQAKLALYKKDVKRFQRLIKQNNVAQNELDKSVSDQAVANSNIAAARARLAQIKERISRSNLPAPFAGVVSERFVQSGEWTQNGNPLIRLVDIEHPEIQVRVPQSIYSLLSLNSEMNVHTHSQSTTADIQTIVPVGTTSSRLFELRLIPKLSLPPGTLVRVSIPTAQAREVVSIHRDALVIRKGSINVYRINAENISEKIPVEVGIGDGDYVELIGDIQSGDHIVTRGGERLRPGETVKITNKPSDESH